MAGFGNPQVQSESPELAVGDNTTRPGGDRRTTSRVLGSSLSPSNGSSSSDTLGVSPRGAIRDRNADRKDLLSQCPDTRADRTRPRSQLPDRTLRSTPVYVVARGARATNRPSLRPATLCSRVDRGRRPAVDVPSARSRRASSRLEAAANRADREARSSLHVSACGTDSDEFEHWISETIEQPAADAIDRVRSSGRLKPEDWRRLASLNSTPQR